MRLAWRPLDLVTRHEFATARGGIRAKQTLLVELEHDGVTGRGEAVPSALYRQTLDSAAAALAEISDELARRVAGGEDPLATGALVDPLLQQHDGQRAAVAAIDSALHDWAGRRLGVPTWRMLGLRRPRAATSFTIGAADIDTVRLKVDEALAAGCRLLKVKVGVENDEQVLATIRERFPGPLLLDANEAWPAAVAGGRMRALARFAPALIEQPLPREEWQALGELRRLGVAPIYADESCERPADVVRLAGLVDGVNIKLNKCGGLREALRMVHLARGLGLGVMIGCFVSSSLAIAAPLMLVDLLDYADLDGHLLLAEDPCQGLELREGLVIGSEAPGLGVAPR